MRGDTPAPIRLCITCGGGRVVWPKIISNGAQAPLLVALSVVVFLVLVALYESWAIPPSVMLVVPLRILVAVHLPGSENDVFSRSA